MPDPAPRLRQRSVVADAPTDLSIGAATIAAADNDLGGRPTPFASRRARHPHDRACVAGIRHVQAQPHALAQGGPCERCGQPCPGRDFAIYVR